MPALLPLLSASQALAPSCRVLQTDAAMTSARIGAAAARSTEACARLCAAAPDCAFFSFAALSTGECALHGAEAGLQRTPGWVAGGCGGLGAPAAQAGDGFPLPGLDYFEKGIEAIQDVVNRSEHVRLPVYAWTYREAKRWFDPQTQQAYNIPDQLSFTENMAGLEQIDDLSNGSFSQLITAQANSFSWGVSVGVNYAGIGASVSYSDNKQWWQYKNEVKQQSNYASHSLMWFKFWEVFAYPMAELGEEQLDPMFVNYLKQLPPTIATPADRKKYDFLVANWGTHYVRWANFGGQLQLDIFTDKSFASEMTQKWMSDQHSLQFHFTLYAIDASAQTAGFHNKSQIHRNSSFLDHSRTYLWYEGGNPALMDDANLVAWKSSVAAAPHRLNVTLSPFYSLPFLPASQAKTLKAFTAQYLNRNTTDPKA